jgi:hypothetical protein
MKRILTTLTIFGLLIGLSIIPAAAQNAQAKQNTPVNKIAEGKKLLAKLITAMGGRARLMKITDSKITCTINLIQQNLSGSLTIYLKENKLRQDILIMGMTITQAFDGKAGWTNNPQTGVTDLPAPVLELFQKESMGNRALLNPEKYGITVTSEGRKSEAAKQYLVLKMTYKDGSARTMFLDATTYLPYKIISIALNDSLEKIEQETIMSDYRVVEGTKVPFSAKILQSGKENTTLSFTEYKYNTNPADSFFSKP